MDPAAEQQQQLRSLRDFLLLYNRMTELCFRHCVCSLNHRLLSEREETCLDGCTGKLLRASRRLSGAYVALMPVIARRRAAPPGAGGHGDAPPAPTAPGPGDPAPGAAGTGT
ncbi:mitochondrial import inner membrane translocase subunit Tim10 B [Rhynochetos jubatus]